MVFLPEAEHGWLPTQHPTPPPLPRSAWRRVRSVVEAYLGPNLYVSTALAALGGIRQKLKGD